MLDRSAVQAASDNLDFSPELALALGDQAAFFLNTGRVSQAEAAAREALKIHQRLLAAGHLNGSIERYVARNFVDLGLILAADVLKDSDRRRDAEGICRRVIRHYEKLNIDFPEIPHHSRSLVSSYLALVNLLWKVDRSQAAEPLWKARNWPLRIPPSTTCWPGS